MSQNHKQTYLLLGIQSYLISSYLRLGNPKYSVRHRRLAMFMSVILQPVLEFSSLFKEPFCNPLDLLSDTINTNGPKTMDR